MLGADRADQAVGQVEVSRLAGAMHTYGITPGDRVAGYLPNVIETIVAMLATTWLGATWSSAVERSWNGRGRRPSGNCSNRWN